MTARRILTALVLLGLALLGWLLAAPQQLGGPVAVMSTFGDSMLPTYQPSDLVVVARAPAYEVGDVVAYHSDEIGTVVLHRIVDGDDEGYVTSGDNNDWLDPDRPTREQLMGTARLRVPQAGRLLEVPAGVRASGVTALGALALFSGTRRSRRGRRRRRGPVSTTTRDERPGTAGRAPVRSERHEPRTTSPTQRSPRTTARAGATWTGWPGATVAMAAVLLTTAGLLGVAAFTTPTTVPGELDYIHRGTFDYTTAAPTGLVYPDGEVTTGEPVFLRLVDTLDLVYTHELEAPAQDVRALGRLWLELADGSGWSHRTPLGSEVEATDEPLVLDETLDVPAVRALVEQIREEAGVAGGSERVDVIAEIEITGTIAGAEIADDLAPTLGFDLSEQLLVPRLEEDEEASTTQDGSVTVDDMETARVEIAGRGLDVPDARTLAVILSTTALVALATGVVGAARRGRVDEAERLRLRYGSKLVDVTSLSGPATHSVAMVEDASTLAALADRAERPILHHRDGDVHTYVVEDDTTQYRYELVVPTPATPAGHAPAGPAAQEPPDPAPADTPAPDVPSPDPGHVASHEPATSAAPRPSPAASVPAPQPSRPHTEPDPGVQAYDELEQLFDRGAPTLASDRDEAAGGPGSDEAPSAEAVRSPRPKARVSADPFGRGPWAARR